MPHVWLSNKRSLSKSQASSAPDLTLFLNKYSIGSAIKQLNSCAEKMMELINARTVKKSNMWIGVDGPLKMLMEQSVSVGHTPNSHSVEINPPQALINQMESASDYPWWQVINLFSCATCALSHHHLNRTASTESE